MKIVNCRTNHHVNPLGFYLEPLTLSWAVEEAKDKKQASARVEIAADPDFESVLFDSGERVDISNLAFYPELELQPRTRYWWRVSVKGEGGESGAGPKSWFETGKMSEPWQAKWIEPDIKDRLVHPFLHRGFELREKPKSARAYVTSAGAFHLEVNGHKAGDEVLTPFYNAYDRWLQVVTLDVTQLLRAGENAVGAMLGRGWMRSRMSDERKIGDNYCDRFALLLELHVTYEDGSQQLIRTDSDWRCTPGPVLESDIYDGETYDAGRKIPGWSSPGTDIRGWKKVRYCDPGLGKLTDRLSPPLRIIEERAPVELLTTPAGEKVLDMGQNMVGWLRFKSRCPAGKRLTLSHGELLQEGSFYRTNLRSAKAEYNFVSAGEDAVAEPYFTFFGFRYVKLTGFGESININDFTGCVISSDVGCRGRIETSDRQLNRFLENVLWSQKGNFVDVPTDCPQRDERFGWTGDAQVFAGTALYNSDCTAFLAKYIYDLNREQELREGGVPDTVPCIVNKLDKKVKEKYQRKGAAGWADAATVIPWQIYLHSGDKELLRRQYQGMKDWVDCIRALDDDDGGKRLWMAGFQFGDWLALDDPDPQAMVGATDTNFVASAYYKYSAELVSKAATVLGYEEDAREYKKLSNEVKSAILQEFFTPTGRCAVKTQTAYLMALGFDLVPEDKRARIAADLRGKFIADGIKLSTGFLGTPLLCRVLSDNGMADYAYRLLLRRDYPGWLYEVKMGATTVWERWNSLSPEGKMDDEQMNSLNHYAYGCVAEWMYRDMCGINPVEETPGFEKILLRPRPGGGLRFARASVDTSMGRVACGWHMDGSQLTIDATVPFNATATMILPETETKSVKADGTALEKSGLKYEKCGEGVQLVLPAGQYRFAYKPERGFTVKFGTDTPLGELLGNAEAREILVSAFPVLAHCPHNMAILSIRQMAESFKASRLALMAIMKVYEVKLGKIDPYV